MPLNRTRLSEHGVPTRRGREIETLLLTMFAAAPLYLTNAIGKVPLLLFHAAMAGIVLRVLAGRGPELIPNRVMKWLALAYVPFYLVDWRFLSGTAIAASTHLVLFIAVYQPIESAQRKNHAQRVLTTALIFVASLATSTHVSVALFVVAFAFLMFRQLMYVSHIETVRAIEQPYAETPSARSAAFYLAGAVAIAAVLFPLLPRVRDPFVQGLSASLPGSSSLSESINFSRPRSGANSSNVIARVWMGPEAQPFFAPVRLKGAIYDRFDRGEWRQTLRGLREVPSRDGGNSFTLAHGAGVQRDAIVQQKASRGKLFLPVGAVSINGLPSRLYEGPARETYYTYHDGPVNLSVRMAYRAEPLRLTRIATISYPVTEEVAALAASIVGNELRVERRAALIESYMIRNFRYLPNDAPATRNMTVEQFLLRDRAGHCEYFAAGMVVLLTSLDIPARIAGGYYGGRLNPLTGYYSIRAEDAHAWTEVWDGRRWLTFDSTPPSLRPGTSTPNAIQDYLSALGDSLNFLWDRWVLTFGIGDQLTLIEDAIEWVRTTATSLRGSAARDARVLASPPYLGTMLLLIAAGIAAVAAMRRRRPLFDLLARHLASRGIKVGPAMTMEDALQQLRQEQPDAARELEPLVALYEEERFSPRSDVDRRAVIRRRLAAMKV
jgi:transglutaminase-like putative cysteine protease